MKTAAVLIRDDHRGGAFALFLCPHRGAFGRPPESGHPRKNGNVGVRGGELGAAGIDRCINPNISGEVRPSKQKFPERNRWSNEREVLKCISFLIREGQI